MFEDYPFPASRHEVMLLPVPPGVTFSYTLAEIINDEVLMSFSPVETCECGAEIPIPCGSVKQMAVQLAATLPLETRVSYGVRHLFDDTIVGLSQDEIVSRLKAWMDKHYN